MALRPYRLPPMRSLVSFEAAARHVSFKAAAKELNVTPAAVSHQVKALEAELRQTLFRRHRRGVELTEAGAYLLVALQRGFEEISDAVSQLRSEVTRAMVTIHATTAVSSLWLTPRLARFWKTHAHVAIAQSLNDLEDPSSNCDLSIHYGDMSRDSGDCRLLFHDRIAALGSPGFAERHRIARVSDFADVPLIHLDTRDTVWTDWPAWCAALGYDGPLGGGFQVNNYVIALQAAQDDMGAVLGWGGLTEALVSSGALVPLWPQDLTSPLDFCIKIHPHASARALLFCNWLLKDAG